MDHCSSPLREMKMQLLLCVTLRGQQENQKVYCILIARSCFIRCRRSLVARAWVLPNRMLCCQSFLCFTPAHGDFRISVLLLEQHRCLRDLTLMPKTLFNFLKWKK